jgi:hypothetical protein
MHGLWTKFIRVGGVVLALMITVDIHAATEPSTIAPGGACDRRTT